MNIKYFASLREKIGQDEETIELPDSIKTVEQLILYLRQRGEPYLNAFTEDQMILVAINMTHSDLKSMVSNQDEVAFFPPVTGG